MDLYSGLLILYFVFFLGLAVKNLKWAIYLVIFGLPSYLIRFEVGGLPMTVLEGMILAVFLVWLIETLKHKNIKTFKQKILNIKYQVFSIKYLVLFIFLFLVAATVAMFMGSELRVSAGIWKAYFIEPVLFLLVFVATLKKKDLKCVFMFLCFSVFILSIVAIYQKITGNLIPNEFWAAEETRRITGVFEYPNALALYLAPVLVLLIGWIMERIKNQELRIKNILFYLFITVSIFIGLLAVYFTKSKGAMLGILAGIIFYAVFYKGVRKYFVGILISVFVLLCFFVFINGMPNLKGASTVEGGDSVTTRLEMWGESWQMLKERPFLGAGLSGYQQAVEPYHQKDYIEIYLYPHNIFLNFWSELGLLGLIGFLGIIGWFYWVGFKKKLLAVPAKRDQLSVILMAGMTTLLVHGLVDVPYFKNDLSILFWVIMGMIIVLRKETIGEIEKNNV